MDQQVPESRARWVLLFIFVLLATATDAIASGITLLAFFQAENLLSKVLLFSGGCIITGLVTLTKTILSSKDISLKFLWAIAAVIDAYTTVVGVVYYVIIGRPLTEAVDLSIIHYDPSNWPKTIIVFAVTGLITGASMSSLFVAEKAFKL